MKSIFSFLLHKKKRRLGALALLKLAEGLCILLCAGALARIAAAVFQGGAGPEKTAPELLVLFFALLFRSLLLWGQAELGSALSASLRLHCRRRLHRELVTPQGRLGLSSAQSPSLLACETVDALDECFGKVLPPLASLIALLPILLAVLLAREPWTGLLLLLTLPIAPFLLYLIGRATRTASERQWQQLHELGRGFAELLRGLPMLKMFCRSRAQLKKLDRLSAAFSAASLKVLRLAFLSSFALELITTLSIALIAVSIGLRLLQGSLDFFTAFFALLVAPELYLPLRQGGTAFHAAMNVGAAMERLHAALSPETDAPPKRPARLALPPELSLRGVTFRHAGRLDATLQNASVCFAAGETTIVTGASGAGKSTLLQLLAGLLVPEAGELLLSGLPIGRIAPADYARHIAYVPQEPHIFHASLRDNVTLLQKVPDAAILSALRRAALGSWLAALPQGLDTPLGEDGCRLSGGQRHRLGLARAILQDAPLLLLDETTAGLDAENERQVIDFLKEYAYRRTVIFASHRPAVRRAFPRHVHLEDGTFCLPKEAHPSCR